MKPFILTLSIIGSIVFFTSSPAFANCKINGADIVEGSVDPQNPCLICDSSRSVNTYSEAKCAPIDSVDVDCQTDQCRSLGEECVRVRLPEHTQCKPAACIDGALHVIECNVEGKCAHQRKKSCDGYACLDGANCATECQNHSDCRAGAVCANNECKIPIIEVDMGTTDMNEADTSTFDVSDAAHVDDATDVSTQDSTPSDSGARVDVTPPVPAVSGGGCSSSSFHSPSWVFLTFGFLAFLSRRRKGNI